VNVEITSEPGLVDPATDEATTDEPYRDADTDFLLTVGPGSPIGTEFLAKRQEAAGEATEASWLREFFAREHHNVVKVVEEPIELAGYWLDVPSIRGAKAKLEVTMENSSTSVTSFTIAGIGGGPKFTATMKQGIGYTATRSRRASLSTLGKLQIIEVTKLKKVIDRYARLIELTTVDDEWDFPDLTDEPTGPVDQSIGYRLATATEDTTVPFTIGKGTELKGTIGIKLPNFGIDTSTELTVGYRTEATITTTLPGGADYRATRYQGVAALFWSP